MYCIIIHMFFTNSVVYCAGLEKDEAKKIASSVPVESPYEHKSVITEEEAVRTPFLYMTPAIAEGFTISVPSGMIK